MSYFQLIDNKNKCPSVYFNGQIVKKIDYNLMSRTWSYNPSFAGKSIKLAQILCNGQTIEEVCPSEYRQDLEEIKQKHIVFLKSIKNSKIDLNEHCFYDLVPINFVMSYFNIKNNITRFVFENYIPQENYNLLLNLNEILNEISRRKLNIDIGFFDELETNERNISLKNKIKSVDPKINYNLFGTITGRLTTKKQSFPILTLDKKFRKLINPTNDFFVEFDFNGAECRTFLSLNGKEQPDLSIHDWHASLYKKTFNEDINRDEIKQKFFAWLYSGKDDEKFGISEIDESYNKHDLYKKYWIEDNRIKTPYGRIISTDKRKAISTLIQSSTSDNFYERVIDINKFLKQNKLKSHISMLIHDNVILDMKREEEKYIPELKSIFANTKFGKYMVNLKKGNNLGNMENFI